MEELNKNVEEKKLEVVNGGKQISKKKDRKKKIYTIYTKDNQKIITDDEKEVKRILEETEGYVHEDTIRLNKDDDSKHSFLP
jgi:hypothetical protein